MKAPKDQCNQCEAAAILRAINDRIGHFADAPKVEGFVAINTLIDVATMARQATNERRT